MKVISIFVLFSCLAATVVTQKTNNFASGKNTIVHLFEWKWDDIADECENFLAPRGYAGVQLSPPNENQIINYDNYDRPWWERYQPVSYTLTTRSGDETSLANMIKRCNAVGVRIYVDAVINHMAAIAGAGTAGNSCNPENDDYPAIPFEIEDFHKSCNIDNWNDPTIVRNCELNGLRDLDQSLEYVRDKQIAFMDHLVDLGVAGFRVDAAKLMWPDDLEAIYGGVKNLNTEHGFPENARPFFFQEVIDFDDDAVSKNEYIGFGNVLEFKFGTQLGNAFQGNNALKNLKNYGPEWGLLESKDAVVFIDNHDNQRSGTSDIVTYKKSKPYKMAIAFMLSYPYGDTSRVMSSFYFDNNDQGPPNENGNILGPGFNEDNTCTNGWVCEHRWREIYAMVEFKNTVEGTEINNWWDNGDNQIAFGRGDKGFVAYTVSGDISEPLQTSLPAGTYCDVISGDFTGDSCTGKSVVVDENGLASIPLSIEDLDGVVAIHVNAKL